MPRAKTTAALVRSIARDTYLCRPDADTLMQLAFDAAAAAYHVHGHLVPDYHPADGVWMDVDALARARLRRLSPRTLERVCALAYRTGKRSPAYGEAAGGWVHGPRPAPSRS